jgi:hypothetical protein
MAEKNNYYGSGIFVAGNIDIGAIGKPADSRVMVPNLNGLAELVADKRVYDGMIVYCESTKTYHKCSVEWDSSMNITSSSWKQVEIQSLDELKALIAQESTAAMEFKGTLKDGTLPTLEEGVNYNGDLYKIATKNITIPAELNAEEEVEVVAKPGDSIVCEGGKWYLIPSGDDIEDTWRAIKVNGVERLSNGTTSNAVDFVQGNNVTISEVDGVITIAAADTHYESKLVAANSATDAEDEAAEDGYVHLNLVENGEVKSSHNIVGEGGISVTHEINDGSNIIKISAAKYDLAAKIENSEAILSLAGTDNTEDKVAVVGDDAVTVTVDGGKIKVSAHDTKYTGSEGSGVKVTVVDDGAISASIEDNAVTTVKIADKNVTLAKLEEAIQTKLGYIDTGKNVSEAINAAIEDLELTDTYVEEEGFEDRVKDIKVTSAGSADSANEATHAASADNATNAVNAQEAAHAVSADEASHAASADNAQEAAHAASADNAQEAAHAASADSADEATHATSADAATHADAAGKVDTALTIKVGGVDVAFDGSAEKTADVDTAIAAALQAAKDYADGKPHENTAHSHSNGSGTKVSAAGGIDGNVAVNLNIAMYLDNDKNIVIYDKDDASKTALAELSAADFIKDGMLDDVSYDAATNMLTFTWNTAAGTKTDSVELSDILDPYVFTEGALIDIEQSGTNITISHEEVAAPTESAGSGRKYLTGVTTDGYGHITGFTTASEVDQDLSGKKDRQEEYTAVGATTKTVTKVEQNANGEVTITYEDIAFPAPPVVNDGKLSVTAVDDTVLSVTTDKQFSANAADNTSITLDIAEKGIQNKHIADKTISAEKTKAYIAQVGDDSEEVWVFYCGTSTKLVD